MFFSLEGVAKLIKKFALPGQIRSHESSRGLSLDYSPGPKMKIWSQERNLGSSLDCSPGPKVTRLFPFKLIVMRGHFIFAVCYHVWSYLLRCFCDFYSIPIWFQFPNGTNPKSMPAYFAVLLPLQAGKIGSISANPLQGFCKLIV